jgi:epoxyqueuosine reductase
VTHSRTQDSGDQLVLQIQQWATALGFSQIGIAGVDLSSAEAGLSAWLAQGFHGQMAYMASHGLKRARPAELVPGTISVITARMDYLPPSDPADWQALAWAGLQQPASAQISLYARGRDYHKVLRTRLQRLAERIQSLGAVEGFRVFCDSAPVLEVELGARSGLGWRGKHTLLLDRSGGSMFFLGEIYIDRLLPATSAASSHCGSCQACMEVCPTQAIVAPYRLDARRCLSYLTIEHPGAMPQAFRRALGNRIYGCDDCQLICPWNKFAKRSELPDFAVRSWTQQPDLCELFDWSEQDFLARTEGSAIRRIGHERWLRNVAVAMGNALHANRADGQAQASDKRQAVRERLRHSLAARLQHPSSLVREHVQWALEQG